MRKELEELCEKNGTRKSGIEYLINEYFVKVMGWTQKKAEDHVIKLFKDGVIDQINVFGKDGKEL